MGNAKAGKGTLLRCALVMAVVWCCGARADAQTLSTPSLTNSSNANELVNGTFDNPTYERESNLVTLSNSATTFSTRYFGLVSTDCGPFFCGARTETLSTNYTVSWTATAPNIYRLTLATSRLAGLTIVDEGTNGAQELMGAVACTPTGGTTVSGACTLADPADNTSGSTSDVNVSQSNSLTLCGQSLGAAQSHSINFVWTQSAHTPGTGLFDNGDESAVRLGGTSDDGSESAANYPGVNGRTQANDGHFLTVTITNLCGNGAVDSCGANSEQCDDGVANGTTGSCCTTSCRFKTAGTTCRGAAGACDQAETCTGASGTCPADIFIPNGTVCRASSAGDVCDQDEVCTGTGPNCPADQVQPNGTVCRASAGACDLTETCDGASKLCPTDAKVPNGTVCRNQNGDCDVAETCNGVGNLCPANGFAASGTSCRASAGVCDIAETCTGTGPNCPADAFEPGSTPCRPAADTCDLAENCPGNGPSCPADAVKSAGTSCRAIAGVCDIAETCDGSSVACPADVKKPSGTACSNDGNPCTVDQCDGTSAVCQHPAGNAGAVCRVDAGDCDVAELCDGTSTTCPPNGFEAPGTTCTSDGEICTVDECDGSGTCTHNAGNAGVTCRAATPAEICDVDEVCDGSNPTCPADDVQPAGTLCRGATPGEICDIEEFCDGTSKFCPPDAVEPATTICRADAGECDVGENCDGSSKNCPPNGFEPNGTLCTSDGQTCTLDICNGSGACTHPAGNSGTVCRPDAGECDVQEVCNGVSTTCPANGFEPSGTACSSDGIICTLDQCNGSGACTHPAGNAGTVCRPDAGDCDVAELCDGTNTACPADQLEPDGTACTDDGLFCTGAETCQSGSCTSAGDPCAIGNCDEAGDQCVSGCEAAPLAGCRTAQKSIFLVKNKATDSKDKLIWKWIKGASTSQVEFSEPRTTTDYVLCVYSGATEDLVDEVDVPADSLKWLAIGTKGYKYKDASGSASGVQKVILKGSTTNKSKVLLKGKGVNLPEIVPATNPMLTFDPPVKVQLVNQSSSICFEAAFDSSEIIKNQPESFKAKGQ